MKIAIKSDNAIKKQLENKTCPDLYELLKDYDEATANKLKDSGARTDAFLKAIAKVSSDVKDDKAKVARILDAVLATIHKTIVAYEKIYVDKAETPQEKKKRANSMRYAKIVLASAMFANKAFLSDEIKDDNSYIFKFLSEIGGEVLGLLKESYIDDPMKFINKYGSDSMIKGKVAKVAKFGKGFEIGYTIGNKLIPFLNDFIFANYQLHANIVNGKVSLYGKLEKKLILRDENGTIISEFTTPDDYIVEIPKGSIITVELYGKQKDIFNSDISPWEINTYIPPQNYLSGYIFYPNNERYTRGCIVKSWTKRDFYQNSSIGLGRPIFSFDYLFGQDATNASKQLCYKKENFVGATSKFSLETLKDKYKLLDLNKKIMSSKIKIQSENDILQANLSSFGGENLFQQFVIRFKFRKTTQKLLQQILHHQ